MTCAQHDDERMGDRWQDVECGKGKQGDMRNVHDQHEFIHKPITEKQCENINKQKMFQTKGYTMRGLRLTDTHTHTHTHGEIWWECVELCGDVGGGEESGSVIVELMVLIDFVSSLLLLLTGASDGE